jgi:DNA polymerase sigma
MAISSSLTAVSTIATRLWPQSRTVLFGSQATGLSLPGGDLDVVILGVSHEMTNPALGFTR